MIAKKPYHKKPKRIGRGPGSGHGKTATKGHKGQRSRSGFSQRPGFEGGQNPFYRRVPKRGFHPVGRKRYAIVNVDQLERLQESDISPERLLDAGCIKKLFNGLKVLGRGELKRSMTVHAHRFSGSAKAAIEKAGGKAVIISSVPTRSRAAAPSPSLS